MRDFDDTRRPLSTERSDHTWESDMTDHELALQALDERPSRVFLMMAAPRVPAATGTAGPDRLSAPSTTRPAATDPSSRSRGSNFKAGA